MDELLSEIIKRIASESGNDGGSSTTFDPTPEFFGTEYLQ